MIQIKDPETGNFQSPSNWSSYCNINRKLIEKLETVSFSLLVIGVVIVMKAENKRNKNNPKAFSLLVIGVVIVI